MTDAQIDTTAEWRGEDWPEFRAGPPWVMAEMIAAQPALVEPILGNPVAPDIAERILRAAQRGEPVVVAGCGTSEHGAQAIAALLDDGLRQQGLRGGLVEARQALEATFDPRPGGICLAISHDGGTRATLLAAEAAHAAGADVVAITGRADGAIASVADVAFVTPALDRSWCHTLAYGSMMLAGAAIGSAIAGDALIATAIAQGLIEAQEATTNQAPPIAERLGGRRPILVCGFGADEITARELALKMEEGPRAPCVARHLETLLHGHLVACDASVGLILIALDDAGAARRDARLALAAEAAARLGMRTAALLSPAAAAALDPALTPGGRVTLPEAPASPLPRLWPLLNGAAALQTLTLAAIAQAGVNPDLIRREEAPYREAAAIAEGASDW